MATRDEPTKAWVDRYVKAAALNHFAAMHGAPIRVQQRFHERYIQLLIEGEKKWPSVDIRTGIESAIRSYLDTHVVIGPGKEW